MEQTLPWLILKNVPGVGNVLYKRFLEHFGTPERVLGASAADLSGVAGVSRPLIRAIQRHGIPDKVKRELDLIQEKNYCLVTYTSPLYPPLLREIHDPPPYFYLLGKIGEAERCIAVVGSRSATSYGMTAASRLSRELGEMGLTIVSGMARGIDSAAHRGALSGKGRTLAVLGSGLENIYPRENRRLALEVAENGAVISEFPLMARPEAHHFPARNRIISGISLGTLVVEAARKSGSLITARMALEQNREVFAVPGSIASAKSSGTHALIKQGAKLVETVGDIIEELGPLAASLPTPSSSDPFIGQDVRGFSAAEQQVLKALGPYPTHIDALARDLSIPTGALSGTLLKLELRQAVQQMPGKHFQRIVREV